jgi:hypothetical protein
VKGKRKITAHHTQTLFATMRMETTRGFFRDLDIINVKREGKKKNTSTPHTQTCFVTLASAANIPPMTKAPNIVEDQNTRVLG